MLKLEIKIWLVLFIAISTVPLGFIWKYLFLYLFWFVKRVYTKIQNKKNLQEMKQKILNKDPAEETEEIVVEEVKVVNKDRLNFKLEKLKFEAIAYKERWDIDSYEKKLIEWLSMDDTNIEFTKLLWDLYFNIWNTTKALPLLKKIIEVDTNDHKTIWQIWQIYYEKWDFQTAKLLIDKSIQLKPDNPKYYVTLAEIMYNVEDIPKSILLMERAIKLRPTNTNYLLATWTLYEDIWDYQNAKKYYFKVLEIEPTNDIAKKKLADI